MDVIADVTIVRDCHNPSRCCSSRRFKIFFIFTICISLLVGTSRSDIVVNGTHFPAFDLFLAPVSLSSPQASISIARITPLYPCLVQHIPMPASAVTSLMLVSIIDLKNAGCDSFMDLLTSSTLASSVQSSSVVFAFYGQEGDYSVFAAGGPYSPYGFYEDADRVPVSVKAMAVDADLASLVTDASANSLPLSITAEYIPDIGPWNTLVQSNSFIIGTWILFALDVVVLIFGMIQIVLHVYWRYLAPRLFPLPNQGLARLRDLSTSWEAEQQVHVADEQVKSSLDRPKYSRSLYNLRKSVKHYKPDQALMMLCISVYCLAVPLFVHPYTPTSLALNVFMYIAYLLTALSFTMLMFTWARIANRVKARRWYRYYHGVLLLSVILCLIYFIFTIVDMDLLGNPVADKHIELGLLVLPYITATVVVVQCALFTFFGNLSLFRHYLIICILFSH